MNLHAFLLRITPFLYFVLLAGTALKEQYINSLKLIEVVNGFGPWPYFTKRANLS
jgi:hypothetical protein